MVHEVIFFNDDGVSSQGSCENIPPGYEAVSLIEALNGPCIPRQPPNAMPDLVETPDGEPATQAAQILNGHPLGDRTPSKAKDLDATTPEVYYAFIFNMSHYFGIISGLLW